MEANTKEPHGQELPKRADEINLIYALMLLVPKNLLSFLTGWLARLRLPEGLQQKANRIFVWLFRIDMSEAEQPLAQYRTIEEVFTRGLAKEARPIASEPVSPADGTLSLIQPVTHGVTLQAKGIRYYVDELVGSEEELDYQWAATIYLAPHNYHRVHSPVAGRLVEVRHIPGELWPVNRPFVGLVPRLFVRNERLVFDIHPEGGGRVMVVMVGALNVGRMRTPYVEGLLTNSGGEFQKEGVVQPYALAHTIAAGAELGTFMLGSTAVVIWDREAAKDLVVEPVLQARSIRMGESLFR